MICFIIKVILFLRFAYHSVRESIGFAYHFSFDTWIRIPLGAFSSRLNFTICPPRPYFQHSLQPPTIVKLLSSLKSILELTSLKVNLSFRSVVYDAMALSFVPRNMDVSQHTARISLLLHQRNITNIVYPFLQDMSPENPYPPSTKFCHECGHSCSYPNTTTRLYSISSSSLATLFANGRYQDRSSWDRAAR